jgi:TRAP-type uncharacterized transport system substrate-binding protein
MVFIRIGIVLLMLASLSACEHGDYQLRFHAPAYQSVDTEAMQGIFQERSGIQMMSASVDVGMSSLEALVANKADLALVQNSAAFTPGVRAVLPVYKSVLHVLVHDDFMPENEEQPLKGTIVYLADNSDAGRRVINIFAKRQGLEPGDYKLVNTRPAEPADLILYFGPINPDNTQWAQSGYTLMSLDERLNPQLEFYKEGVGYIVPNMHTMVIPAYTYEIPGNREPILTVAADTLLVARKDLSVNLVYELTKTLIEQKPRFTAIAPQIFSGISESFDPLDLNFPLHNGARRYLHRDEPGVLERYAESINLLAYLIFLILSAVVAFMRWRAHTKKDRIDTFYTRALGIAEQADGTNHADLLLQLHELEQEAFRSLIAEKLAANESFRIFTDLLQRIRADLSA